ncbi:8785_t:CDS:1 [Diversispora eburnea]|uniref:8785_t:CDS:1 n=1 Tax=Diversispora eburnea TaxID=1213867 RepID=A0A9N9F2P1_9GLOM|nr:8785_t:CDS:1 [Diversispora eburnea]
MPNKNERLTQMATTPSSQMATTPSSSSTPSSPSSPSLTTLIDFNLYDDDSNFDSKQVMFPLFETETSEIPLDENIHEIQPATIDNNIEKKFETSIPITEQNVIQPNFNENKSHSLMNSDDIIPKYQSLKWEHLGKSDIIQSSKKSY